VTRLAARSEQDDPEVGAVEFYLNAGVTTSG
jgi:hypothetical protein